MRIQITGADLDTAARWAARLAPTSPTVPVMAGARLVATDGQLRVSATDDSTFGTLTVPAQVAAEGEIIVSARLLHTIAATIPKTAEVSLSPAPSTGKLAVQVLPRGTRWSLPELPGAGAWTAFPDLGKLLGEVPAGALGRALNRVLPAVGPESDSHVIRGVSCETGGTLTLTATDRYRLAIAEVGWERAPGTGDQQMTLPADLLKLVSTSGDNGIVRIHADGNMIGLVSPPYQVIGRLLAGEYPRCRSIFDIPESKPVTRIAVDVAELSLAVTQASAVASTGFDLLRLTVAPDGVGVSLDADDTDAESSIVESQHWTGEPLTVGITPRYLLDALACLGSPMTALVFAGPRQPVMLRPADKDGQVIADGYGHLLVTRSLPDSGTAS